MLELFATRIDDPDYGVYYDPTILGYTVCALILILLILLATLFTSRKAKQLKAKELAFCSLALALAYITSTFVKLIHMPMGGSITLFSMLFVTLIGYWFGLRTGLLTAAAYGMLQLVTGPWIISLPQLLFDYVLSFTALGLSGLFCGKKHGLILGYLTAVGGRFFFSFISGMVFFGSSAASYNLSVPVYSLLYNGAYIGGEALLTVLFILIPPVASALLRVGQLANEN